MSAFPEHLLERALGPSDDDPPSAPCVFRDASLLGLVGEQVRISDVEYRSAVDRRHLRVVRRFCTRRFASGVLVLQGRQIGTLGSIVPTGRAFSTLAHVLVDLEGGSAVRMIVESGLVSNLTASGVWVVPPSRDGVARLTSVAACERPDLLAGDVGATYWARAWGLPPRLSRLAVMLMAGISPQVIAERTGLSLRSVRTYTEALLARAGVHSRNELALAALRDGRRP